jgi:hypothetical protein
VTRQLQESAIRRFKNITGTGVCVLCGLPSRRAYCHAHSWAFGTETTGPAGSPQVNTGRARQEKRR